MALHKEKDSSYNVFVDYLLYVKKIIVILSCKAFFGFKKMFCFVFIFFKEEKQQQNPKQNKNQTTTTTKIKVKKVSEILRPR